MAPYYCDQESFNYYMMLLDQRVANYLKNIRSRLLNNSYAVRTPQSYPITNRGGITLTIG